MTSALGCRPASQEANPYAWREQIVEVSGSRVTLTVAQPRTSAPPPFFILFASGDGGLQGTSLAILRHLAQARHWVAGFSSEEGFAAALTEAGKRPNYIAIVHTFTSIAARAKQALGIADRTPMIVTGMSRGASAVVAVAGEPSVNQGILGAVAIALTNEFDWLTIPEDKRRSPGVALDDQGRIRTYSGIVRLGPIPLAIIQSMHDRWVPSAESRRELGPDTATRRLYEVESADHSFDGGYDALMRDLDDAVAWIAASRA